MPTMTMIEAICDAHFVGMERDDRVVVFGEDVGHFGGVFRCTLGLQERFGTHRCFDAANRMYQPPANSAKMWRSGSVAGS